MQSEKTIHYEDAMKLQALKAFLSESHEALDGVLSFDTIGDEVEEFNVEDFFLNLIDKATLSKESSNFLISETAGLLTQYIPSIAESLAASGQEQSTLEFYHEWLDFLKLEKYPADYRMRVISKYGKEVLSVMPSEAGRFNILKISMSHLLGMEQKPEADLSPLTNFLLNSASTTICDFAKLGNHYLEEEDPIFFADNNKVRVCYHSFLDGAVNAYEDALNLLGENISPVELRKFIKNIYEDIWPTVKEAMLVYEEVSLIHKRKKVIGVKQERKADQDSYNLSRFMLCTLEALQQVLPPMQFAHDAVTLVPDTIDILFERKSSLETSEVFAKTVSLLVRQNPETTKEIVRTSAAQCILSLVDCKAFVGAAKTMQLSRVMLDASDQILTITKPGVKSKKKKLGVILDMDLQEDENSPSEKFVVVAFSGTKDIFLQKKSKNKSDFMRIENDGENSMAGDLSFIINHVLNNNIKKTIKHGDNLQAHTITLS